MSRYRRSREGGSFFFTVVTCDRREILCTELGRHSLRSAIRETRKDHPFAVFAFVLLPDHLHAVWSLPDYDRDYSLRWRLIKARFTRAWIAGGGADRDASVSRVDKRERGVWQRRFFEHTIRDESDLRRCTDYVHVNPLKHGLVARVRDWPWSSFHRFVRSGDYAPEWGSSAEWYGDEFEEYE